MDMNLILFIITALEKGVSAGFEIYHETSTAILAAQEQGADEKLALLERLNKAFLPPRDFSRKQ